MQKLVLLNNRTLSQCKTLTLMCEGGYAMLCEVRRQVIQ